MMSDDQIDIFDLEAGRQAREEGIETTRSANAAFVDSCREYAKAYAIRNGEVTNDDVRKWATHMGIFPKSCHAWGAIFKGPNWHRVGFTQTKIKTSHARPIGIWEWREV